ncbi:MAG: phosphoribosylformylglycinamidine synthase subunit PurQ [Spirochaeta sp.]
MSKDAAETQSMVKVAVLYGHGINADRELGTAFETAGGTVTRLTVKRLVENPDILKEYQILALPGGFSFGDHLGSGLVLAQWIRTHVRPAIDELISRGGLVLGICNGFQVLVKMGLLPNLAGDWQPEVSLVHNDTGTFINTWVPVVWNGLSSSPWLKNLPAMMLPIRHGEGRFIVQNAEVLRRISDSYTALRYRENPNGSMDDIAGIVDVTGQVLGLMPHPEAFIRMTQHPQWQRLQRAGADVGIFPTGLDLFRNGIAAIRG